MFDLKFRSPLERVLAERKVNTGMGYKVPGGTMEMQPKIKPMARMPRSISINPRQTNYGHIKPIRFDPTA